MKHIVHVFGSEDMVEDSVPFLLARKLANDLDLKLFHFECSFDFNSLIFLEENVLMLDVVKGIDRVCLLTDPSDLVLEHSVSCHDLDLGFFLSLQRECGSLKKLSLLAVPYGAEDLDALALSAKEILLELCRR
ncbi:hypothetical protein H6501_06040 [Candidatus Woesearchaeota archaeon]|nr:hypothetical protein [Candidatus Woesearchaeota archaeon]USN43871.1 MAG: hypothetical protein H6500_05780 [Candidatus Woesearchaeota archaeon]